jgi:transcriptional regulator with XRE-family HTH domain
VADRASTQARLGRAVKQVRIQRGLTQEQVSAASGLHPTYISDIERGARNPSWEAITRLAGGIGVSTADIAHCYDTEDDAPAG